MMTTKKKMVSKNQKKHNRNHKTNKKKSNTKIISKRKSRYNRNHKVKNEDISLEKVNCSPKDNKEVNKFTCYTDKSLIILRDKWNNRHPDAKINTNDTRLIHKLLSKYLSNVCNKESCWLKQNLDFGELSENFKDSFAPESPNEWKQNPNEWLTSIDIIKVMKQYEKAYKCFDFMGPTPIDFEKKQINNKCVWEELCNFNLKDQLNEKKTKIGIIFNTDTHDKPGKHWISMFINIKTHKIFFFDSVGNTAPVEVMDFVDKIKYQGEQMNPKIKFEFDENHPVEHQYGDTECGMYSIFFIIHMLEDKLTSHYLKTHILKDEYMESFRKIYFNDNL